MARKKTQPVDFEKALSELEGLVERMEQGEMSLEESLAAFQRGVELTRACRQALTDAEQRVQVLLQEDAEPEPFSGEED